MRLSEVPQKQAVAETCEELGVSHVDLMLIHGLWILNDEQTVEVWRGLVDAKAAGLAKHIGVSNFDVRAIERVTAATGVAPAAHQLEFHPWVGTEAHAIVEWCQRQRMAVTA